MQSDHDYKVDERVLIRDNQVNKYETPYRLPYPIIFFYKWYCKFNNRRYNK